MKRSIIILASVAALLACSRETASVMETLGVSYDNAGTRVQISGSQTVWNAGDKVSVFYDGTNNECWNYAGEDKAASGSITHVGMSGRSEGGTKIALYPYSASAALSGSILNSSIPATQYHVADSFGDAVMTAVTTTDNLVFKYASSFIALDVKGMGTIKRAVLSGYSSEIIAGDVNVDVSGENPALSLASGASAREITLKAKDGDEMLRLSEDSKSSLWFCIPPMTFSQGFKISIVFTSGNTRECRYTLPVSIARGEVLRFNDEMIDVGSIAGKKEILLDFRNGNKPFTEDVVPGSTKHYRESADPTETEDLPNGKSAFTKDGNYEFAIYTHYGLGSSGSPSYGIYYNSSKNYVSFGRAGSYIRTPAIPGYRLYNATYEAGSTAGTPCFSSTADGANVVSEKVGTTVDGGVYTFTMFDPEPDKSYYMMVNSGNLTFRYINFLFIPE